MKLIDLPCFDNFTPKCYTIYSGEMPDGVDYLAVLGGKILDLDRDIRLLLKGTYD